MIGRLWRAFRSRRETRAKASLDALKVRYHTFRVLLANNERALDRLAAFETALAAGAPAEALAADVENLLAVAFEMVDGAVRLDVPEGGALYDRQLRLEEALRTAVENLDDVGRGPSCLPLAAPLAAADVGGKAAGLSQLTRNGFPVPDGFAVTVRACRDFLRETGLEDAIRRRLGQAPAGEAALAETCAAVRRDILSSGLPDWLRADLRKAARSLARDGQPAPALAARSSALTEDRPEHSFAGQFVSELNLSADTLEQGFLAVMAGAFTEQAAVYRREAGLPPAALDMAVLVQVMVPAVAAGVVFTIDPVHPETERMLVSAVPGLGVLAVSGAAPVDVYRIDRTDPGDVIAHVARKTRRAVAAPGGGLRREPVPRDQKHVPVLGDAVLSRLARLCLAAEALAGTWSDLEFALDGDGALWLLQCRPARIMWGGKRPPAPPKEFYRGGMAATPGRCLGRALHVDDAADLGQAPDGPVVAVLPTAAPEAARGLALWQGAVVAGGNPADHLSTVARETGRPMLTRAAGAVEAIPAGALIVLDADAGRVTAAPAAIGDVAELLRPPVRLAPACAAPCLSPARLRLHELLAPLTLTGAYGPTFSVLECRTLHDIIRFTHEVAVMALFSAGDALLSQSLDQVRILRGDGPFEVMVIDLGGGLRDDAPERHIRPESVASIPLAALWRGLSAPGQRAAPLPGADASGVFGRGLTDARSRRPVGEPNYALAARDYVNVNARVEFHFAMIDAVCGPRARGNHVRLRFKGGGASPEKRRRRARCLERILKSAGFFVSRGDDLLSASLADAPEAATAESLVLLGRLLGFARLLDAAMTDDDAPDRAADAFLAGDAALAAFTAGAPVA